MHIFFVFMCKYVCIFMCINEYACYNIFLYISINMYFFDAVVQNHLGHLTLCKRCLNCPNAKWKTTDCLSFSI